MKKLVGKERTVHKTKEFDEDEDEMYAEGSSGWP